MLTNLEKYTEMSILTMMHTYQLILYIQVNTMTLDYWLTERFIIIHYRLSWKQEDISHFVTTTIIGNHSRITTAQPKKQQGIDCLNKGTPWGNEDCTLILTVHWWAPFECCQGLNNSDRSLALSESCGSWTRLQRGDSLCLFFICFLFASVRKHILIIWNYFALIRTVIL